jgi:aryl-phospho-beta-D-glucosidase BglC (GH1 family)
MNFNNFLITIIFLSLSQPLHSQNLSIQDLNKKLGRGINMGNMFEAPTETEWGNPFKDDYFERISQLGFNHVRIPIRWDIAARSSQTEPYTINPAFLARIKYVIDKAYSSKLYVVINMHHHEEVFANPEKTKPRFISQWEQIATFFKDYDQKLLFEVLNEPNANLTPDLWNTFFSDALKSIRKTNPTRAVLMGTANYGGLSGVPSLKIPDDKNIILTVHYYNPFNFTHQGAEWVGSEAQNWLGTIWEDLALERNQIISEFDYLNTLAKQKNIPVQVGEFGAYSKADIESRVKWTTFLARWFEEQGFSWAYWEFSAGFGIYTPATQQYNTKLVDALIKNTMSSAKVLPTKMLYQSDFSSNDGWNLGVQTNSSATLSRNNGLNIDVKTASKDGWHVQLTKGNIPILNKKRYLVSIKAKADKDVSVINYIGKNAPPYNSYSGYSNLTFGIKEKEFSYTFVMNDPSDLAARMSFDLGTTIANINISSIKVEEIIDDSTPLATEKESSVHIFPNPIEDILTISALKAIQSLELIDQKGNKIFKKTIINEGLLSVSLQTIPSGSYILVLYEKNGITTKKVVKN